jgi:hypothetical protein
MFSARQLAGPSASERPCEGQLFLSWHAGPALFGGSTGPVFFFGWLGSGVGL